MRSWFIVLAALVIAAPAGAQQWQVARDQFAFAGSRLTIYVDGDAEGTLRVIRGGSGLVRVSGRADMGMTGAGLTAYDELSLTAMGHGPVDYLVSVPDRVRIEVRLPGRVHALSMASTDRSRTFHWGAAVEAAEPIAASLPPAPHEPGAGYTVFAAPLAPETIFLPDLARIRTVTVRVEGEDFRIAASRPLSLQKGDPRHIEIRPVGTPLELTVTVPAGTAAFQLDTAGGTALTVRAGEIGVHCEPNTRQWLPGGRGWVTFTPVDGELRCASPTGARHRG